MRNGRDDPYDASKVARSFWFARPAPQVGAVLTDGRYTLHALVGKGNCEVWRGFDAAVNREVAIKFLPPVLANNPDELLRFHRALDTARRISGPLLCPVYDYHEDATLGPFLTMMFVHGQTLLRRLAAEPPLTREEALDVVGWIAVGLDDLHRQGVVHRDVKPANVMLVDGGGETGEPLVRIVDFEFAAEMFATMSKMSHGSICGTVVYMAPESCRGERPTQQVDQYALACIAYELLSGRPPFYGAAIAVMNCHINVTPKGIPELPDAANRAILKALAKDPEQRFETCREFAAALKAAFIGAPRAADEGTPAADVVLPSEEETPAPEETPFAMPPLEREEEFRLEAYHDDDGHDDEHNSSVSTFVEDDGHFNDCAPPEPIDYFHPTRRLESYQPGKEVANGVGMIFCGFEFYGRESPTSASPGAETCWLGKFPVSQREYQLIVGKNPSFFAASGEGAAAVAGVDTSLYPVECVTWDEALEFCRLLTLHERLTGDLRDDWSYSLPDAFEWQCAAESFLKAPFPFGPASESHLRLDVNTLFPAFSSDDSVRRPVIVGALPSPRWGRQDRPGNGWEWCRDEIGPGSSRRAKDRQPMRPVRGGGWGSPIQECLSTTSARFRRDARANDLGFRVCVMQDRS